MDSPSTPPIRVLFVCLGNICRSPTAEAVFKKMVVERGCEAAFELESAGVGSWHVGEPADARMKKHAAERGYDLNGRARQVHKEDFDHYDVIIAMDDRNFEDLRMMDRKGRHRAKIHRMTSFCTKTKNVSEVPDPYYGGADGFEIVLNILEDACSGLLAHLLQCQPASATTR